FSRSGNVCASVAAPWMVSKEFSFLEAESVSWSYPSMQFRGLWGYASKGTTSNRSRVSQFFTFRALSCPSKEPQTRGGKSNRNSKAAGPESGTLCTSTTLVSRGVEFLTTGKRHQRLGGDGANPVRRDARLAPAGLAARRH